MDVNAGSVGAWLVFFLLQAVPTGATLLRLSRAPRIDGGPREGKVVAFDSLVFMFLFLLLLLGIFVSPPSPRGDGLLMAAGVAAVYTLILSAEFSSHAEVGKFAARILSPAPNIMWLLVALSAFPALFAIGYTVGLLGPSFAASTLDWPSFPGGRAVGRLPLVWITNTVFAGGVGGEPFWRGIIYARLRKRRSLLRAAFVTGIAQAAWLVPGWLVLGQGLRGILVLSALWVSASPVFAWVYERSGRSFLAAVILFGSMMTAMAVIPVSIMTAGALIMGIPAAMFAEKNFGRRQ